MLLFVYYKFEHGQFASLLQQLAELRTSVLTAHPEVVMRVMKRPGLDDKNRETWMEMYELVAEDLEGLMALLTHTSQRLGMPMPRATELFEAV